MTTLMTLRQVCMDFAKPTGEPLQALADVNFSLREGEILGLLGRSGSGKSTLLRIADGILKPSAGEVSYAGKPVRRPVEGIAMVFQTFALFPWLTVLENVQLGLDALGVDEAEAKRRANAAIETIGLEGFQQAYPREISGGMRQRVGFARAMVVDPQVLLMDEPFSALDVLTAESLRTDFLDLWMEHQLPIRSVLLVTHNIEEAVLMCDRVLVLGSHPGHITAEIPIDLTRPRSRVDGAFRDIVDDIYAALTTRTPPPASAEGLPHKRLAVPLPAASVGKIVGLVRWLVATPYAGQAQLAVLASDMLLEVDDLFPLAEALQLLEFAELKAGQLRLTTAGRLFGQGNARERRRLFAEHLLAFVPLAAHIRRVLNERDDHCVPLDRFRTELGAHLNELDTRQTLRVVSAWGRYAGVFSVDDRSQAFVLRDAVQ